MINTIGNSVSFIENASLNDKGILWQVIVTETGEAFVQSPTKGQLNCSTTFKAVEALRKVADRLEEAALEVEAILYGEGGNC